MASSFVYVSEKGRVDTFSVSIVALLIFSILWCLLEGKEMA